MVSLPHISIKRSSVQQQQQQQHQHQHQQQQNANERKEKKISSRSYLDGMAVAGHAAGFRRNSLPSDWSNFFLSGFVGKGQPDWPPGGAINSIFDFIFVSFFLFLFFYGETCGDDTVEEKNDRKSHWWNQKKISIQSKSEYENSRSHWTVFNEVKVSFFISRFSDFIDSIRLELIFFGDRLNGMRR